MSQKQMHKSLCYRKLTENRHWFADTPLAKSMLAQSGHNELFFEKGSLTAALTTLSKGSFDVNVLSQKIAIPYWHEQKKLKSVATRAAYIREVELLIQGNPVVYARTIIPHSLVGRRLQGLGKTPLGHLLFKDGRMRVSKRQFAAIESGQYLIQARRTPYEYQGETILVSEFFLPKLNDYLA